MGPKKEKKKKNRGAIHNGFVWRYVCVCRFVCCLAWWPGASLGGQAPRWYPHFRSGDLFVATLKIKWPSISLGSQAPRWYPRLYWAVPKKEKNRGGNIHWTCV